LFPSQAGAAVVGSMGVLGLMLACIGLYGVLLYSVARRTPEIGLRVALGASSIRVLNLVLRQTMTIAAAGLGIGLAIAVFVSKPLAMFLVPELSPTDLVTFAMVIAVLLAAALAATIVPVVRALRVDPITALRYE
jgi:ABC-type antimicrobial peptide transport system permease subunit